MENIMLIVVVSQLQLALKNIFICTNTRVWAVNKTKTICRYTQFKDATGNTYNMLTHLKRHLNVCMTKERQKTSLQGSLPVVFKMLTQKILTRLKHTHIETNKFG